MPIAGKNRLGIKTGLPRSFSQLSGQRKAALTMAVVAGMAACLGLSVYLLAREPIYAVVALFQDCFGLGGASWGGLADHVPTFAHTLCFSLLTASLLPKRVVYFMLSTSAWVAINLGFEVLQKAGKESAIVAYISGLPFCYGNCFNYLHHGTYDTGDVYSILLGGLVGLAFLLFIQRRRLQ